MKKKITAKEKEYMRKRVGQGDSVKVIAKELGVSETTVYKYTQVVVKPKQLSSLSESSVF